MLFHGMSQFYPRLHLKYTFNFLFNVITELITIPNMVIFQLDFLLLIMCVEGDECKFRHLLEVSTVDELVKFNF